MMSLYARALLVSLTLLTACMTASRGSGAGREMLYTGLGRELAWYDVDVANASLVQRGSVMLPANVQNVWAHPSRRSLVVVWSDGGPGLPGTRHGVSAFSINGATGALTQIGTDVPVASRAVHLSGNRAGTHALLAHNDPSGLTVIALKPNGELDREVVQPVPADVGVFAHQVLTDATDNVLYLVTRGIAPTATAAERPGAIKEYRYANGILTKIADVAPGGGFGFQARNLDFHPTKPWVYLVLEQQNALHMYDMAADHLLSATPRFTTSLLEAPPPAGVTHTAGAIAMHPSGKFVYAVNRASGQAGTNSVAVFAIDEASGKPERIATVPTLGSSVRTFGLDARGELLVVGNQSKLGALSAGMVLFRIGGDGIPVLARKYDVETATQKNLLWVGFVRLP